jgi:hypothetical protein
MPSHQSPNETSATPWGLTPPTLHKSRRCWTKAWSEPLHDLVPWAVLDSACCERNGLMTWWLGPPIIAGIAFPAPQASKGRRMANATEAMPPCTHRCERPTSQPAARGRTRRREWEQPAPSNSRHPWSLYLRAEEFLRTCCVMIGSETNTPRRSGVLAMRSFMMLRVVIGLPSATLSADIQCPIFRS